jgi:hypothetical protein
LVAALTVEEVVDEPLFEAVRPPGAEVGVS